MSASFSVSGKLSFANAFFIHSSTAHLNIKFTLPGTISLGDPGNQPAKICSKVN